MSNSAKCKDCGEIIVSERGGHFVSCSCGMSSIDTDRWFPDRVRLIGSAELITTETEKV